MECAATINLMPPPPGQPRLQQSHYQDREERGSGVAQGGQGGQGSQGGQGGQGSQGNKGSQGDQRSQGGQGGHSPNSSDPRGQNNNITFI